MLPPFPIPVDLGPPAGTGLLIAQDVPPCVLFYGHPDSLPGTACWEGFDQDRQRHEQAASEAWLTGVLTRVIVAPRLTPELVHRLGPARQGAILAYFAAIGWTRGEVPPVTGDMTVLDPGRVESDRWEHRLEALRPYMAHPGPNLGAEIRLLAAKTRTPPHVIWREWAMSDFACTYHVLGIRREAALAPEDG